MFEFLIEISQVLSNLEAKESLSGKGQLCKAILYVLYATVKYEHSINYLN